MYQVAIVGSSLAGAAAASILGQAGVDTILIDKSPFPRTKACGEGISAFAVEELKNLGMNVENLIGTPLCGYSIIKGDRRFDIGESMNPRVFGIQRRNLDASVLEYASSYPSITTHFGDRITGLLQSSDSVTLELGSSKVRAEWVIGADGLFSVVARESRIPIRSHSKNRYGVTLRIPIEGGSDIGRVLIFVEGGIEVFCTVISPGLLNLSALGTQSRVKAWVQEKRWLDQLNQLKYRPHSPYLPILGSGPFGARRRDYEGGRVILVGDALESFDPAGGMGMTHAIFSGISAGRAIVRLIDDRKAAPQIVEEFVNQREGLARPIRGFTRATTLALSRFANPALFSIMKRSGLAESFGCFALGPEFTPRSARVVAHALGR